MAYEKVKADALARLQKYASELQVWLPALLERQFHIVHWFGSMTVFDLDICGFAVHLQTNAPSDAAQPLIDAAIAAATVEETLAENLSASPSVRVEHGSSMLSPYESSADCIFSINQDMRPGYHTHSVAACLHHRAGLDP